MTALQYLDSLIAGASMSTEVPIQLSELELLRKLLVQER